ncbi:hypothetical protein HDV01_007129 [Terramyces sp. JEL0728]|nr:hypothetical protein HDV01_007129 [Terramyces sp. JEL0728]
MQKIPNEIPIVASYLRIDEYLHFQFALKIDLFIPALTKKYYLQSFDLLGPKIQRIARLHKTDDILWLSEYKLYEELKRCNPCISSKLILAAEVHDDELLLGYLQEIPLDDYPPICENICKNGLHSSLAYLYGKVDFSIKNNYLLFMAIWFNQPLIVELLLKDERVDPSLNDNSAISIAANSGKSEIVAILLKDSRVDCTRAMIGAKERNHKHIVALLNGRLQA